MNEVDASIQRLFYWGAYADKYGGTVQVKTSEIPCKNYDVSPFAAQFLAPFFVPGFRFVLDFTFRAKKRPWKKSKTVSKLI